MGLGVAAAWLAAPLAAFAPLLWVALLLAILALPPGERRLLGPVWLAAALAVVLLSWTVALDHELAFRLSLLLLAAVLLAGLARRAAPSDAALGALAAGIALTAAVALWQAAGGLAWAQGHLAGLDPSLREAARTRLASGRVFGTAALPGHFAILQVTALPLLLARGWRAQGRSRAAWWAGAALAATGVVLSRSLAGVAVAGALLLVAAARRLPRRLGWALAAAVLVAGAVALATRGDVGSLEPLRLRWINWRTTAWVLGHHPWVGVGFGGVGQAGLTAPMAAANITPYAHNTPLELVAELGLAGAGLVIAAVVALVRLVRDGLRTAPALALAVLAVPLHNLVDFSLYTPEVLLPWAVLVGALVARTRPAPARAVPSAVLVPLLAAGALLSVCGWRAEVLLGRAGTGDEAAVSAALDAAVWSPWAVTPVLAATGDALRDGAAPAGLVRLERLLEARAWVRPVSAGWAEARARLLLAEGRRGEALPWAREAAARAPWRDDLRRLEEACAAGR